MCNEGGKREIEGKAGRETRTRGQARATTITGRRKVKEKLNEKLNISKKSLVPKSLKKKKV